MSEKAFNIREFKDVELYEKLHLLLERMELSEGWKDISLKINRTKFSLSLRPIEAVNMSMQSIQSRQAKNKYTDLNQLKDKIDGNSKIMDDNVYDVLMK